MIRFPLLDAASGAVIYLSKMHLGLKRNFQVMPGAEWLELLCKHIPDRYEQLVRYCGWYSSRAKAAWAQLIRKVYETDALECPKCKGPIRVIALIEGPVVVRAILTHLGRWQPKAVEHAAPLAPEQASLPLTYHSVPDIA